MAEADRQRGLESLEKDIVRDLFEQQIDFEKILMPEADVQFLRRFPFPADDMSVLRKLHDETPWQHQEVLVWGKRHLQPRLTAWYGDPGKIYSYSGADMNPFPWTNLLLSIKREVEELVDHAFNSALLNLYRDNNDRMGFHSDNEPSLGDKPIIASLSFGATRKLIFKHKRDKSLDPIGVNLVSGSLLLMKGETQKNWNHGINRQTEKCGPRINITFRNIFA